MRTRMGRSGGNSDPVKPVGPEDACSQFGVGADGDAVVGRIDVEHIERSGR